MVDVEKIGGHSINPWRYEFEECGGYDCMTDAYVIYSDDGNTVATIDLKDYGGNDDENGTAKDNADLISRSPCILVELKRLREAVKQYFLHSDNYHLFDDDAIEKYKNEIKELICYQL